MGANTFWTPEEEAKLLHILDSAPVGKRRKTLAEAFPNRSLAGITDKGKRIRYARQFQVAPTGLADIDSSILELVGGSRKSFGIQELANLVDRGPDTVAASIEQLRAAGHRIKLARDKVEEVPLEPAGRVEIPLKHLRDGKWLRFGALSDSHLCNRHSRLDVLNVAFDHFEAEGIREVFHAGNWIDGEARFNRMELVTAPGFELQLSYFLEHWPQRKGITTRFIDGDDHEGWYAQQLVVEPGRRLEQTAHQMGRTDLHYLGYAEADIPLKENAPHASVMRVLHGGGGACFDDETEIMTEDGWRKFYELNRTERVATLNTEANAFEWQLPYAYTDESYSGEMLHFKARCVDLLVTPNHRMWARPTTTHRKQEALVMPQKAHPKPDEHWAWSIHTAEEMASNFHRQKWQLKRGGQHWEGKNPSDGVVVIPRLATKRFGSGLRHIGAITLQDAAELIAWYVTEGHIDKRRKTLALGQSKKVNPANHERIVELLRRIGFEPRVSGRDQKDIAISSRELCEWLVSECNSGSRQKHLPVWLKACTSDILSIVFGTMIDGDGWRNGESFCYKSISSQLRDDMSEVATKLGWGTTERGDTLGLTRIQIEPTIQLPPQRINYSGRIYCVSVPNETILVRRNGKAIWSANSYAISYSAQKMVESWQGGDKPAVALTGHHHKHGYFYIRNVHTWLLGTLSDQSLFMRKRKIEAHLGFWVISLLVDDDGSVKRAQSEWFPFFDLGYYQDRYPVGNLPKRKVA